MKRVRSWLGSLLSYYAQPNPIIPIVPRRRLQLAQVEPDSLVVGALGADGVALVPRLAGRATRGAHPIDGSLNVVDAEHRDHSRPLRAAAETGHRGDIWHVPGVGPAARLEAHAQDRAIEGMRTRRVGKFEDD